MFSCESLGTSMFFDLYKLNYYPSIILILLQISYEKSIFSLYKLYNWFQTIKFDFIKAVVSS